ncbi:hypothetical protein WJX84_008161 [Apatococcus fuscideae]|uniref:CENP-V/GFA domain-containing protein n=1 Tax=Apatococcus fuscideae TaxID=2026836 RepID=A0AAW1TFY0_9CHLO
MASGEAIHLGGCRCGKVKFTLKGSPVSQCYCHCHSCRIYHTMGNVEEFSKVLQARPALVTYSSFWKRNNCLHYAAAARNLPLLQAAASVIQRLHGTNATDGRLHVRVPKMRGGPSGDGLGCAPQGAGTMRTSSCQRAAARVIVCGRASVYRYIDSPSANGMTPLHLATLASNPACIRALTDAGASMTARSSALLVSDAGVFPAGSTPLHIAAQHDDRASVRILLQAQLARIRMRGPSLMISGPPTGSRQDGRNGLLQGNALREELLEWLEGHKGTMSEMAPMQIHIALILLHILMRWKQQYVNTLGTERATGWDLRNALLVKCCNHLFA